MTKTATRLKPVAASQPTADTILVPLNKLKKSPHNVRQQPHSTADIAAL